ncbi:bacterial transcriptional activator domain-containing protein [Chitinimonas lacunae]|uniref:Bacterial transcriptional activator domain-containing protein n=1 Tax=Chitinimonas lacunae TaxID=1963018 RepID=A0ABV8MMD8_9NEIS
MNPPDDLCEERRLRDQTPALLAQPERWRTLAVPSVTDTERARLLPWSTYWQSLLAVQQPPDEARRLLEAAYQTFCAQGDPLGKLLGCAAVIETFHDDEESLAPLDDWIATLLKCLPTDEGWLSPEVEVQVMACGIAVLLRDQSHPLLTRWAERGEILLRKLPRGLQRLRLANFLLQHYIWRGNFGKSGAIIDAVNSSVADGGLKPIEAIHWYQSVATYCRFVADHERGLAAVEAGLPLCREAAAPHQAYALNSKGVSIALSAHDADRAEHYLEAMRPFVETATPGDQTHYWNLRTGLTLLRGELKTALEYARTTLINSGEIGGAYRTAVHHVSLALVLLARGEAEPALQQFEAAGAIGERIDAGLLRFSCALLGSACLARMGYEDEADARLATALKLGAHEQYLTTSAWWLPNVVAERCARALALDLEPTYVRRLIRYRQLRNPDPTLEQWPCQAHLHAFGSFSLQLRGEPLTFGAKAQNKPLELLKLLLANGGRPLGVARVMECLWPEAEGEARRKSFDAALLRLRRLLDDAPVVNLDGGKLGLQDDSVWSDVHAFLSLAETIDRSEEADAPRLNTQATRLLALYRAPFLEHEEAPWALEARERLRKRFVGTVDRLGARLEVLGLAEETVRLYERATDADPLAESLYRRLMGVYLRLGRQAEALRTYRRCRDMLSILLGIRPSAETERLAREISAAVGNQ